MRGPAVPDKAVPQTRTLLAVHLFAAVAGIIIALGFVDAGPLALMGSFVAMTWTRHTLGRRAPSVWSVSSAAMLIALVAFAFERYRATESGSLMGAQAALGPLVGGASLTLLAILVAVHLVGLAAAVTWLASSICADGTPVFLMDIFGGVLAGTVITGILWGPPFAAIFLGPARLVGPSLITLGISLISITAIVALVAPARRHLFQGQS